MFSLAVVGLVLYDVFETVVVPRRTDSRFRLAPPLLRVLWPVWQRIGLRISPSWRREDFLATFAPSAIVAILIVWVVALIFGFGVAFYALADELTPATNDFGSAMYAAGTALLTIGYGDIVPTSFLARTISILAAASGLAVLALVISLIFNLYNLFSRREVLVLLLDPRAGAPPSGVALLETFGERRMIGALADLFYRYELWTAEMLDSHLAYPLLPYFRSSHDNQSWISALGAVLDAATLLRATAEEHGDMPDDLRRAHLAAEMMYHTGCHAITDLSEFSAVPYRRQKETAPGIERVEFAEACRRLAAAGYHATCTDATWESFAKLRAVYGTQLNLMARYLAAPPTQWIGDRSAVIDRRGFHMSAKV